MPILIGAFASIAVFLLAVWPRCFKRYFGVDTWRILTITDFFRKYRRYPDALSNRYLVQGKFDHPVTLSAVLALFPKKMVDDYQWLVSPLIETAHCFVLFLYVYRLTGSVPAALLAQFFYTLTPMVLIESSQLSTRSIGSLCFTLAWLPIMHFCLSASILTLFTAIVMVVVLTFTHRMSTQVLVLMSLLYLLLTGNPMYLFLSISGIGLSWLCFGDRYKRILRGHLMLMNLWRKHIDKRYAHQVRGIPDKKETSKQTDFVRRVENIFVKLPGLSLLAPNIWMAYVLFIPFLPGILESQGAVFFSIYLWAIFLFVLGIATSVIKPLRFMGSGDRYIEYSAFPVAAALSMAVMQVLGSDALPVSQNTILFVLCATALLGALLPIVVMQFNIIIRDDNRSISPGLWKAIHALREKEKESDIRLACIPHQLSDAVLYFTEKTKVYLTDSNHKIDDFLENWWPVIKKPVADTLAKRQITHLLLNVNYAREDELGLCARTLLQEGPYLLLELKSEANGSL